MPNNRSLRAASLWLGFLQRHWRLQPLAQAGPAARHPLKVPAAENWTDALAHRKWPLWAAMVFGGVESERLQLNEDTLWSGGPHEWNNPGAKQHLAEVRLLVLEQEDYVGADRECRQMQGPYNESYLPLANLHIQMEHAGLHAELPA